MKKTALLAGATGLTGAALLEQLLAHPAYDTVVVLVRRELPIQHPKLRQIKFDFDHPNPDVLRGDDFYCALGTTLAKAGSKEAQYKIDCTYPSELGRLARANGVQRYLLVSSVGADAQSGNFYLRTKGELENNLKALKFDRFVAARPSFLLGQRQEFRLGERIGIVLSYVISPLLMGGLRKYKGIQVRQVAAGLIRLANDGQTGNLVVEYDGLVG